MIIKIGVIAMLKSKIVLVAGIIMLFSITLFSFLGYGNSSSTGSSTPFLGYSFAALHYNQGFIVQVLKNEGAFIFQLTEDIEAEHDAVIVDGDSFLPYQLESDETIKAYLDNGKGVLILNADDEHKSALKDHIGFAYGDHSSLGYFVLPKAGTLGREFYIIDCPRALDLERSNFSARTPDSDDAEIEFDEEQFLQQQEEFKKEIRESTGPQAFAQAIIKRLKENKERLTDSSVGDVTPPDYCKYRSWTVDQGRETYVKLNTAWMSGYPNVVWVYPAGGAMAGWQQIAYGHTTVITVYLDNDAENVTGNFQWLTVDHQGWWDTVDGDNHSNYVNGQSVELPLSPDAGDGKNVKYNVLNAKNYKMYGWGWTVMSYSFAFTTPVDQAQNFSYVKGLPQNNITETSVTEGYNFNVSYAKSGASASFGVSKSVTNTVPDWKVEVDSTPSQKTFNWFWKSNDPDWDQNKIQGFKDNTLCYKEYEPASYGVLQTNSVIDDTINFTVGTGVGRLTTAARYYAWPANYHYRHNFDMTNTFTYAIDFGAVLYPLVTKVTMNPSTVIGGESASGTVTLDQNAPAGGVVVNLSSNNTSWATVPATVTIPEGQGAQTFPIATYAVDDTATATITAELNKVKVNADMTVQAQ